MSKTTKKIRRKNSEMVAANYKIADILDGWQLSNGDLNLHVQTGLYEVTEIQIPRHRGNYPDTEQIIGSDGVPFPQ